jgi:hypothetical protein
LVGGHVARTVAERVGDRIEGAEFGVKRRSGEEEQDHQGKRE